MYQQTHPNHPWLTKEANSILSSYIQESDRGLEFGSGRSTIWFAKRVSFLTSVEHDSCWYSRVHNWLMGMNNIEYLLVEKDEDDDGNKGKNAAYVKVIDQFEDNSLDFVLVDGAYRGACAIGILQKIRPGGLLIIDNANWFLPCKSFSPNSRTYKQGAVSQTWKEFLNEVEGREERNKWRKIWTSSGVTDTAFYFKPCQ
jgi:predicted O-methyltransferase YrrM